MKKDVRVCISGSRIAYVGDEREDEDISVLVSGSYAFEDGLHKISYDELLEDSSEVIYNTIFIDASSMRIQKKGVTSSVMSFSKEEKATNTKYSTPYGDIFMKVSTHNIEVIEKEDRIIVDIDYSLSIENEVLSSSKIQVDISSK